VSKACIFLPDALPPIASRHRLCFDGKPRWTLAHFVKSIRAQRSVRLAVHGSGYRRAIRALFDVTDAKRLELTGVDGEPLVPELTEERLEQQSKHSSHLLGFDANWKQQPHLNDVSGGVPPPKPLKCISLAFSVASGCSPKLERTRQAEESGN